VVGYEVRPASKKFLRFLIKQLQLELSKDQKKKRLKALTVSFKNLEIGSPDLELSSSIP